MRGLLLLAIFGIASFWLAIESRTAEPIQAPSSPQAAAVALLPTRVPMTIDGTIVLDDAPAKNTQPFILFTEQRGGRSIVKTKRLIFPTTYACMKGDIPCAFQTGELYPFTGGERIQVTGVAEADLIYVETLRFL